MSQPHTVIAILEAKPNKAQKLEAALSAIVQPCRNEPACLKFHLHKSTDNPNQFILYETWASQAEHQQQFEKPYIKDFAARLDELLAKPYEVYFAKEL